MLDDGRGRPGGAGGTEIFQMAAWPNGLGPRQTCWTFYHREHHEYMRVPPESGSSRGTCSGRDPSAQKAKIIVEKFGRGPRDIGGSMVTIRGGDVGNVGAFCLEVQEDEYCSFTGIGPLNKHFWIIVELNDAGLVAILHAESRRWLQWAHGCLRLRPTRDYSGSGFPPGIGACEKFQKAVWID